MSKQISKFLSLLLRHDPARIGIALDEAGWTDVDGLLAALAAHGQPLTREELHQIVAASDKQRFALSPDGARIRANQGHSVPVDLQLAPSEPPALLYHGTVAEALEGIRAHGLQRQARHHVHLSPDVATAKLVGGRRGRPVVLRVRAGEMHAAGHVFYRSANGVWLVDEVPPRFLEIPEVSAPSAPSALAPAGGAPTGPGAAGGPGTSQSGGDRVRIVHETLAACDAGAYTTPAGERVALRAALDAAVAGTVLHAHGEVPLPASPAPAARRAARVAVTGETTLEALARLAREPGGHLACLNYASAVNPGGGVLLGAHAQEESLARSSGLYPCLLAQPAHYERNRAAASALYLDLAIFSPAVPFFRDDAGGWLPRPLLASVITCAAPNAYALRQQGRFDATAVAAALRRRAGLVLAVAAHHGVARLVLGAWGAGAFGNDPVVVAAALRDALDGAFRGAFDEVVMAVPPGPNHAAFAAAFG